MGDWGYLGGGLTNKSSKKLIIAYNNPNNENEWVYSLVLPGKRVPASIDVDGFRAQDTKLMITYNRVILADITWGDWWKISNTQHAYVRDDGKDLRFMVTDLTPLTDFSTPQQKTNGDFEWTENSGLRSYA